MTPNDALETIDRKFKSANSTGVERATVTREEWDSVKGLIHELDYLEFIASSILHGHLISEVDWPAFKALKQYFDVRHPPNTKGMTVRGEV